MLATVSPEIEPNCIPTACSITQGNGTCLINNLKKLYVKLITTCRRKALILRLYFVKYHLILTGE